MKGLVGAFLIIDETCKMTDLSVVRDRTVMTPNTIRAGVASLLTQKDTLKNRVSILMTFYKFLLVIK